VQTKKKKKGGHCGVEHATSLRQVWAKGKPLLFSIKTPPTAFFSFVERVCLCVCTCVCSHHHWTASAALMKKEGKKEKEQREGEERSRQDETLV
jgi:hypothetical protein